jgi:hypothetical protein
VSTIDIRTVNETEVIDSVVFDDDDHIQYSDGVIYLCGQLDGVCTPLVAIGDVQNLIDALGILKDVHGQS